ncbi:MAG: NAD(P)/FAD-dependent oxidoreductase [Nocardioidaceae bacterium]|nr:NAD(P)/FAD-dependent oxidoreductase [Nocardioidaceae bacterium]
MVIVGGGHNGLVAATYLGQAGLDVLVLERLPKLGGAAVSSKAFSGVPARVSRYADLVGLLPDRIVDELGLDVELRARSVAAYAPVQRDGKHTGLLVERTEGQATADSFRELTGSDKEYDAWRAFRGEVRAFADAVAPTMLEPLRTAREVRELVEPATWEFLVEAPIGREIERRFGDDTVRGVVAADALVGTFADLQDESLVQNRAFLQHALGSEDWKVPVGGMGALTESLAVAARNAGVTVLTSAGVSGIESDGSEATVTWHDGEGWKSAHADWVLANVAPWVLQVLLGEDAGDRPEGAQFKVNMVLERLPRLRSGVSRKNAFAGTMHVAQGYERLQEAYAEGALGQLPSVQPGQFHCHSLTDPSVLGPLAVQGMHTLTYVGVHTPARAFEADVEAQRDTAVGRALDAVNDVLEEPIESLIATDKHGRPCLEAKAPQDVDEALAMPGGHIFHGDLAWPWTPNRARLDTPAQRWGVATDVENVLLCGSGARRGGAVSGLGGHNAAQAVLEARRA